MALFYVASHDRNIPLRLGYTNEAQHVDLPRAPLTRAAGAEKEIDRQKAEALEARLREAAIDVGEQGYLVPIDRFVDGKLIMGAAGHIQPNFPGGVELPPMSRVLLTLRLREDGCGVVMDARAHFGLGVCWAPMKGGEFQILEHLIDIPPKGVQIAPIKTIKKSGEVLLPYRWVIIPELED